MSVTNHIYEFEGDVTQVKNPFYYKFKEEIFPKRIRFLFARIVGNLGDLTNYWHWVRDRIDILNANNLLLAEGGVDGAGGRIGGGFVFAEWPIAGTLLFDSVDVDGTIYDLDIEPIYAGDLSLQLEIYQDGTLIDTIDVYSQEPFRLGITSKSISWQFRILGNVENIKFVEVATSMAELKNEQAGE